MMYNLQKEAKKIRLRAEEKAAMRAHLRSAMQSYGGQAARPSPYVFVFLFSYPSRMVFAGFVLFVCVGVGTASAAAGSALPGDLLYSVKISLNERVEVALAGDTAAEAAVEARLAQRRVSEAQTLETQGRLDATTTAEIEIEFEKHASRALALAGGNKPLVVATISSDSGVELAMQAQEIGDTAPRVTLRTTAKIMATTTATVASSTRFEDDDDIPTTLKIKRELLKELRDKVDRRERGEVESAESHRDGSKSDNKQDKQENSGSKSDSGKLYDLHDN